MVKYAIACYLLHVVKTKCKFSDCPWAQKDIYTHTLMLLLSGEVCDGLLLYVVKNIDMLFLSGEVCCGSLLHITKANCMLGDCLWAQKDIYTNIVILSSSDTNVVVYQNYDYRSLSETGSTKFGFQVTMVIIFVVVVVVAIKMKCFYVLTMHLIYNP